MISRRSIDYGPIQQIDEPLVFPRLKDRSSIQDRVPFRDGMFWRVRIPEILVDDNGKIHRLRPIWVLGSFCLTQREAEEKARRVISDTLRRHVSSDGCLIALRQFIVWYYRPLKIDVLKAPERHRLNKALSEIMLFAGDVRLQQLTVDHIAQLQHELQDMQAGEQLILNVESCIHSIINFARLRRVRDIPHLSKPVVVSASK